jgi:hypothetical protein
LFDLLGRKCVNCGFDDERALQFDHINGGGTEMRKVNRSLGYYKTILEDPDIKDHIQILCANCNWIKLMEEKEYLRNQNYGSQHNRVQES